MLLVKMAALCLSEEFPKKLESPDMLTFFACREGN